MAAERLMPLLHWQMMSHGSGVSARGDLLANLDGLAWADGAAGDPVVEGGKFERTGVVGGFGELVAVYARPAGLQGGLAAGVGDREDGGEGRWWQGRGGGFGQDADAADGHALPWTANEGCRDSRELGVGSPGAKTGLFGGEIVGFDPAPAGTVPGGAQADC